jgi:hypothetical protein
MFKAAVQPLLVPLFSSVGSQERARVLMGVGARIEKVQAGTRKRRPCYWGRCEYGGGKERRGGGRRRMGLWVHDTIIVATRAPSGKSKRFRAVQEASWHAMFLVFLFRIGRCSRLKFVYCPRSLRGPSRTSPVFASLVLSLEDRYL